MPSQSSSKEKNVSAPSPFKKQVDEATPDSNDKILSGGSELSEREVEDVREENKDGQQVPLKSK